VVTVTHFVGTVKRFSRSYSDARTQMKLELQIDKPNRLPENSRTAEGIR
jgi:hypothetical protein